MRIKFRAWDRPLNRMVEVVSINWPEWFLTARLDDSDKNYKGYSERHSFKNEETDRFVLMQFTGLKDKNGVEIFEGDVVKICGESCPEDADDEKHIMVIKWDKQGGYISEYNCGFEFDPLIGNDDLEMEVIGNIYEHPHILTNGK